MTWYVVDGMDGAGKSTAGEILVQELESRGRKVLFMEHPNRSTLAGRLESAFLLKEGKLFVILSTLAYVADVLHSLMVMRGRKGREADDVVFVRYSMAVAYLSDGACSKADRLVKALLPKPDVAVLVDVDPDTAMERIMERGEGIEIFETSERLGKIRSRMLDISDGWIVLDNSALKDTFRQEMVSRVFGDADAT